MITLTNLIYKFNLQISEPNFLIHLVLILIVNNSNYKPLCFNFVCMLSPLTGYRPTSHLSNSYGLPFFRLL